MRKISVEGKVVFGSVDSHFKSSCGACKSLNGTIKLPAIYSQRLTHGSCSSEVLKVVRAHKRRFYGGFIRIGDIGRAVARDACRGVVRRVMNVWPFDLGFFNKTNELRIFTTICQCSAMLHRPYEFTECI